MKTIFNVFLKLHEFLIKAVVFFSCFSMLLVAFAQVVCRYVFKYSIVWSDEYCRLAFFVTIFFGSALCFLDRKHIVVDVIYNILPKLLFAICCCLPMPCVLYSASFLGWRDIATRLLMQHNSPVACLFRCFMCTS